MIAISNDLFSKKQRLNPYSILNQLLGGDGIKNFTLVFVSRNPERDAKENMSEILKNSAKVIYETSTGIRNQDKMSPAMLDNMLNKYDTPNHIIIFKDFLDSVNVYDRAKCRFQSLMHKLRDRDCQVLVNYDLEEFRRQSDKNINWSYRKGKSEVAKIFHKSLRNPENAYILNLEREKYFKGYDPRNFKSLRLPEIDKEEAAYREKVVYTIEALKSFVNSLKCNFDIFEKDDYYNPAKGVVSMNDTGSKTVLDYLEYSKRSKAEKYWDTKNCAWARDENNIIHLPKAAYLENRSQPGFDRNNSLSMRRGITCDWGAFEFTGITPIATLRMYFFLKYNLVTKEETRLQVLENARDLYPAYKHYPQRIRQLQEYYNEGTCEEEVIYEFQALGEIFNAGERAGLSFDDTALLVLEACLDKGNALASIKNAIQQQKETEITI